jgi:hypothetical protein
VLSSAPRLMTTWAILLAIETSKQGDGPDMLFSPHRRRLEGTS